MPDPFCPHNDGYFTEVESHYGTYNAWVCADCGLEVPLDE